MTTEVFKIQRFRTAAFATFAILIAYIFITIYEVGGEYFVNLIGNLVPVIFSFAASLFFLSAFSNAGNSISKRIWGYICLGLAFWTIAELTWGYYAVILERDVPYPSLADLFWLVGYPLVYAGFIIRYRTLFTSPSSWQRNILIVVSALFIVLAFYFVIWPIIVSFDFDFFIESVLNIFYPLADFGLLILASLVLFSLEKGKHSSAWQLILFGFFLMSISDLGFSYADWNGIYYPEGVLNTPSFLIDVSYSMSYMAMALGIYASSLTSQSLKGVSLSLAAQPQAKSNVLVYIDNRGRILRTSENVPLLADSQDQHTLHQMSLSNAFALNTKDVDALINTLSMQGFVGNRRLKRFGPEDQADLFVSGVAWKENELFTGATLVFQTSAGSQAQDVPPLNEEQEKLIAHTLAVSGTQVQEDTQSLRTYYAQHINLLYFLLDQFSGTRTATGLVKQVNQKAARENWRISMEEGKISISDEYVGQELANCLSSLLKVAQTYALNFVGLNVIQEEQKKLDMQLGEPLQRSVRKFLLQN